MRRIGHQHAELGDTCSHQLDADAAHDIASILGEDELLRLKQLRYLLGRGSRPLRLPHSRFRCVIDPVYQLRQLADRSRLQISVARKPAANFSVKAFHAHESLLCFSAKDRRCKLNLSA
jgi:hypothetical protein